MDKEDLGGQEPVEREELLNWLQSECVFVKSKKSRKKASGHTAGELHCKVCDAHLSFDEALAHVRTETHQKRKSKREREKTVDPQSDIQLVAEQLLAFIPEPTAAHYTALQHSFLDAYEKLRLSDAEIKSRYDIVARLERLVNTEVQSEVGSHFRVQFTIFGSVCARIASRCSDTNISVRIVENDSMKRAARERHSSETNPTFLVARIVRGALERSGEFESVIDAVESGNDCDAPLCFECRLCPELRQNQAERAGAMFSKSDEAVNATTQRRFDRESKFLFIYDPFGEKAALRSADLLRCYALLGADLNNDESKLGEIGDDLVTRAVLALVRNWFAEALIDRAESGTLPGVTAYWMAIYFLQRAGHLPVLHAFHDYRSGRRQPKLLASPNPAPTPAPAPAPDSNAITVQLESEKRIDINGGCLEKNPACDSPAVANADEEKNGTDAGKSPAKSSKLSESRTTGTITILRRGIKADESTVKTSQTSILNSESTDASNWQYDENNALRLSEAQCEQLDPLCLAFKCARWVEETFYTGHNDTRISWKRVADHGKLARESRSAWASSLDPDSDTQLARLLVAFFRFYSLEFEFGERVIAVRCASLPRKAKLWHAKRAAIEDPFALRVNLCRSLATSDSFEHVLSRLQRAFLYLSVPQLSPASVSEGQNLNGLQSSRHSVTQPAYSKLRLRRVCANRIDEIDVHVQALKFEVLPGVNGTFEVSTDSAFRLICDDDLDVDSNSNNSSSCLSHVYYQRNRIERIRDGEMQFDLRSSLRSFRKNTKEGAANEEDGEMDEDFEVLDVPPFCAECNKAGHLKAACPQNALPTIDLEPARKNRVFLDALTKILLDVERGFTPTEHDEATRDRIASELRHVIGRLANTAELHTFGSSRNGFAFPRSDLDLCLKLADVDDASRINVRTVLRDVHRALHRDSRFDQLHAVLSAKVPIVRFRHVESKLDGDISVYNCLAIENTRMLRLYRDLDPRVKTLGFVLKYLTKMCDISDASKGSLSSYAYTLMLIYFLQQRNPPVLPVLQELTDVEPAATHDQSVNSNGVSSSGGNSEVSSTRNRLKSEQKLVRLVDGWDCWFQEDKDVIQRRFKALNKESVGELWLAFLAFYTTEFAYKRLVVAIRQRPRLYKREKCWSGSSECLAIEDPFELSHNLGCGLTYKMNMYILRVFHNELKRCCEAALLSPSCLNQNCLFDIKAISPGEVPTDRCCRRCGHIGHIARECRLGQEDLDFDVVSFPPLVGCLTLPTPLLGAQPGLLGVGPQAAGLLGGPPQSQPPPLLGAPPFAIASNVLNAQVVQRFTELANYASYTMPSRFGHMAGPTPVPTPVQQGRPDAFHPAFYAPQPASSAPHFAAAASPPGANGSAITAFVNQTPVSVPVSVAGAANGIPDARRDGNFGANLGFAYTPFCPAGTSTAPTTSDNPFTNNVLQNLQQSAASYRGPPPPNFGITSPTPFAMQQQPSFTPFTVQPAPFVGQQSQRSNNSTDSHVTNRQANYGHNSRQATAGAPNSRFAVQPHVNAHGGLNANTSANARPNASQPASSSWSDIVKKSAQRQ